MDRQMPPPPARSGSLEAWEHVIDAPLAGPRRRPVVITVAGVLLVVAGGFAALAGLLILLTGDGATIEGVGDGSATLPVIVSMVLACLEIGSGALVLRCAPVGRTVGIVVAALGIAAGLAAVGSPRGLVTIAIFGFVVFALVTNAEAFGRPAEG
jgi:hypothetical protein